MQIVFFVILFVIISVILLIGVATVEKFTAQTKTIQLGLPIIVLDAKNGSTYPCDSFFSTTNQFGNMLLKCSPYSIWDRDRRDTKQEFRWEYWKEQNTVESQCNDPEVNNGILVIDISVSKDQLVQVLDWRSESDLAFQKATLVSSSCILIDDEVHNSFSILFVLLVVISAGAILWYIRDGF